MSCHVNFLLILCHLVHASWLPSDTALACLCSSSRFLISFCIKESFSASLAVAQRVGFSMPRPWRPVCVVPMTSFNFSWLSASWSAWKADHFLPVLTSMPAFRTLLSLDCFRVVTSQALATLNSSTSEEIGSCNWFDLPYRPMLEKLGGTPSHLRRCLLMMRSRHSALDVSILHTAWEAT